MSAPLASDEPWDRGCKTNRGKQPSAFSKIATLPDLRRKARLEIGRKELSWATEPAWHTFPVLGRKGEFVRRLRDA